MATTVYTRPGVYVIEQLQAPPVAAPVTSPSVAGFIGESWRGPINIATQINSWGQFVQVFGGFNPNLVPILANPYLPYAVYMFFLNGGQACYVTRIASSASPGVDASITLIDGQATPHNTLSLAAGALGLKNNPGTWGNQIYCSIAAMLNAPTRFVISLYYGGTSQSNLVEVWNDLSMALGDSRYAPSIINSSISGSNWVVATDLSDPNTPNNYPAPISGQQFSGGVDPSDPSTSDWEAALTQGTSSFDNVPGVLNLNMPGETTAAIVTVAITYAQTRPSTFLVLDPPSGQTVANIISYFGTLGPVSAYAALYYPWVTASNPATANINSTILLPPGGFVLGQMTAIDTAHGPWWAPAGDNTILVNAISAEQNFTQAQLGTLNAANIDAIRTRSDGSLVIWGARTMSSAYATLYVPIRRSLNYIEAQLTSDLNSFVFEPNDSVTWSDVVATATGFLQGLYSAGAFPGPTAAQSFYVICDATNNTPQSIAQGILNVTVGVAFLYPAEFIVLTISQFQSTGQTTVTVAG